MVQIILRRASSTLRLNLLYIPHGSDNTSIIARLPKGYLGFISHMVQIILFVCEVH